MTARISPMVCMLRIRFFFIDIVRFLLRSDSHWVRVCGLSADLWLQTRCLRELLADDRAHLADGLHTADQIFHNHNWLPPEWSRFFSVRNKSSSGTYDKIPGSFPVLLWSYCYSYPLFSFVVIFYILCPPGASCIQNQKRSERIIFFLCFLHRIDEELQQGNSLHRSLLHGNTS